MNNDDQITNETWIVIHFKSVWSLTSQKHSFGIQFKPFTFFLINYQIHSHKKHYPEQTCFQTDVSIENHDNARKDVVIRQWIKKTSSNILLFTLTALLINSLLIQRGTIKVRKGLLKSWRILHPMNGTVIMSSWFFRKKNAQIG